jgi:Icc-related predicted phosphoesterase
MLAAVDRVQPRLHVFGHVHGGYGEYRRGFTTPLNCSICDERYDPTNKPIAIDIDPAILR